MKFFLGRSFLTLKIEFESQIFALFENSSIEKIQ